MSEVVPFLLLGEKRRTLLAEYVRGCVRRWQQAWGGEQEPRITVEVQDGHAISPANRWPEVTCFRAVSSRGVMLYLQVPARSLPELVGLRGAGAEADRGAGPKSLASRLELEALRMLARELLGQHDGALTGFESLPDGANGMRAEGVARYRGVLISLGDGRASGEMRPGADVRTGGEFRTSLFALLSPACVAAVLPARGAPANAESLARRRSAVVEQPAKVEVVLGHSEVSIAELAGLTVGDVIVLEKRLGEAADLIVAGGGCVGQTTPGQFDGRWAVQIKGKL